MTQQQVANKAGITLRHYQMFESGEREIINASFRVAMAVIMTLDINPENIIHNGIYVPCDNVEKRIKNDC